MAYYGAPSCKSSSCFTQQRGHAEADECESPMVPALPAATSAEDTQCEEGGIGMGPAQ